jgi:VanZ family protein
VAKIKTFLKYWLPVLVWMGVIFSASSDTKSFERSSRIIAPLVRFFFPRLQAATVDEIVFLVRKCAHLTEYAVMALLFWRALRKPVRGTPRPWQWREARTAILLVALYAASDEFHQLFVPSRQALVTDVIIDTTGGIVGLLLVWGIGRWLKKW